MTKKKSTKSKKGRSRPRKTPPQVKTEPPTITPYPQGEKKVAAIERDIDQILGEESRPGDSSGRPGPGPEPERQEEYAPIEIIRGAITMPFELFAIKLKIPEFALTDSEAMQMATPMKALLDHYQPNIPPVAWAWGALATASFWVGRPRMIMIYQKADDLKSEKSTAEEIKAQNEALRSDDKQPPPPPDPANPKQSSKFPTIKEFQTPKS